MPCLIFVYTNKPTPPSYILFRVFCFLFFAQLSELFIKESALFKMSVIITSSSNNCEAPVPQTVSINQTLLEPEEG